MNCKTPLYFGMLGGAVIIGLFLVILFSLNLFNYRIQIDKIEVNNLHIADSLLASAGVIDTVFNATVEFKKSMVDDLKNDKVVLTPQEYTNNVVNYYNSILLVLSVMLAAFSILSFVYLKSQSNDLIQEKLQSNEFKNEVTDLLVGKAEDRFQENLTAVNESITTIKDQIADIREGSNDIEILV